VSTFRRMSRAFLVEPGGPAQQGMARLIAVFVGSGLLLYLGSATGEVLRQMPWAAWWYTALMVGVTAGAAIVLLAGAVTRRQRLVLAGAALVVVGFPLCHLAWALAWSGHLYKGLEFPWALNFPGLAPMAAVVLLRGRWVALYHVILLVSVELNASRFRPDLEVADVAWYAFTSVVFSGVFVLGTYGLYRSGERADLEAGRAESAAAGAAGAQAMALERDRVDALIHDEVLSTLLAVVRVGNSDEIASLAGRAMERLEVSPSSDQNGSLEVGALVGLLRGAVASADPSVKFDVTGPSTGLTARSTVARELAAATIEAVRNSVLHSGDTAGPTVSVEIVPPASRHTELPAGVRITVRDEGVGFDTGSVPQIRLGLRGSILGRMKAVPGGTAEITSRPGHGTTVRIGWTP
jgi:signal transduction histidine kinase